MRVKTEADAAPSNVINIMDALRRSVAPGKQTLPAFQRQNRSWRRNALLNGHTRDVVCLRRVIERSKELKDERIAKTLLQSPRGPYNPFVLIRKAPCDGVGQSIVL